MPGAGRKTVSQTTVMASGTIQTVDQAYIAENGYQQGDITNSSTTLQRAAKSRDFESIAKTEIFRSVLTNSKNDDPLSLLQLVY